MTGATLGALLFSVQMAVGSGPRPAPIAVDSVLVTTLGADRYDGQKPSGLADCLACASFAWRGSDAGRDQSKPAVVAVAYSHGYQVRARMHRIASTAMLPLFATEAWLGASLYDNPTPGKRTAHVAVASAIGGLFAANTVTGVWNLIEARKDPHQRRRRILHGVLMLAADGGFLATALAAPAADGSSGSRATHRALAVTSISTATAGYLLMLFRGR
jgi:hypothetical protein